MLTEFSVKNFRRFRDLTVAPLARVNLIAGKNSVGKTALLEALFFSLGPGNPEMPVKVDRLRGILMQPGSIDKTWAWLFHNGLTQKEVQFVSTDDNRVVRTLCVRQKEGSVVLERAASVMSGDANNADQSDESVPPSTTTQLGHTYLELAYKDSTGAKSVASVQAAGDELAFIKPIGPILPTSIYMTARSAISPDDVERFSTVDRLGQQQELIRTLRRVEPRLKRLAVVSVGGSPMIYGDVGVGQLVPIQLLGGGIVRLLSLSAAIANAPGGAVLIDEIENGLHHSVMTDVWKAVGAAARRFNTQVFATTHSRECIESAHSAFSAGRSYDFRLHRLESVKDDILALTYSRNTLKAALLSELEVR